ncbi:uncharacterized protein LOC106641497 [Copidosoma floridanum]|uniref:uncharacterized protein LOC106641497 n=1 Tax=Copidosoma floridanum TaxID=29053 RepID=UPI0006C9435F|nr:uncharacterized protein LOC106641497 [Copidosoma floridanum]
MMFKALLDKAIIFLVRNSNIFDPIKFNGPTSFDNDTFVDIILELTRIVELNSFEFGGTCESSILGKNCPSLCGERNIGILLLSLCSLINHSCYSNTKHFETSNLDMFVCATKPIKKGEQITISYKSTARMDKIMRQRLIKASFAFICNCTGCEKNWSSEVDFIHKYEWSTLSKLEKHFTTKEFGLLIDSTNSQSTPLDRSTFLLILKAIKLSYGVLSDPIAHVFIDPFVSRLYDYFNINYSARIFSIPGDC